MAVVQKRIAGVTKVRADSIAFNLGGTVTVSPQTVMREGLVGLSGVAGYREMPRVPFIEIEVHADANFSLEVVEALTNATVQAELANGKSYILSQAWFAGESSIGAAEGVVTLRFDGVTCDEVER
jgi:hypothetical protein